MNIIRFVLALSLLVPSLTYAGSKGQGASKPALKRFTSSQLRQLVDCMLRLRIDKEYYGPILRFKYVILPPWEKGREEELRVVVYDPGKKTGLFLAYGFKRDKCMRFHLGNESPLAVEHGKADLDEEHMGNGGIGTYNGFMNDLRKLLPTPTLKMDIRHLHGTCARCLGPDDPEERGE